MLCGAQQDTRPLLHGEAVVMWWWCEVRCQPGEVSRGFVGPSRTPLHLRGERVVRGKVGVALKFENGHSSPLMVTTALLTLTHSQGSQTHIGGDGTRKRQELQSSPI